MFKWFHNKCDELNYCFDIKIENLHHETHYWCIGRDDKSILISITKKSGIRFFLKNIFDTFNSIDYWLHPESVQCVKAEYNTLHQWVMTNIHTATHKQTEGVPFLEIPVIWAPFRSFCLQNECPSLGLVDACLQSLQLTTTHGDTWVVILLLRRKWQSKRSERKRKDDEIVPKKGHTTLDIWKGFSYHK